MVPGQLGIRAGMREIGGAGGVAGLEAPIR